jgi:hypothetical protein
MSAMEGAETTDDGRALLEEVQGLVADAVQLVASEKRRLAGTGNDADSAEKYVDVDRYLAVAGSRLARIEEKKRCRRMSDEDRQTVDATRQIAKARIQIITHKRLHSGTYFSNVDQVWRPKAAPYSSPDLFEALRRDKAPTFVGRSVIGSAVKAKPGTGTDAKDKGEMEQPKASVGLEDVYATTAAYATNSDFEAALELEPATTKGETSAPAAAAAAAAAAASEAPSSSSPQASQSSVVWESSSPSSAPSYPPEIHQAIWTTDIFGKHWSLATAPVANLVPRCHDKAALYYDVAACTLGLDDGAPWEALQKAIFGSRPKPGEEGAGGGTLGGIGIKNLVPNKIRLGHAMEFFDRRPCVLVVPVLALEAAKAWRGEPYRAIVLPGAWTDPDGFSNPLEGICHSLGMWEEGETATPSEVEQARGLLERVVLGLAHSLHTRLERRAPNLTEAQRRLLAHRLEAFRTIPNEPNAVYVPEAISPAAAAAAASSSSSRLRVRIAEFQSAAAAAAGSPCPTGGHPAPDPLLLAVRAAVNWSWRNHQKVLESGEPERPIHPLEAQAMEEFLAWRDEQQQVRPQSLQDVANGLHQPDGYRQGDEGDDDNDNEDVGDVQDDDDDDDDAVEDCYDAVP